MPSTVPECRRQAESLCWASEGVTCSTCQATLSTQHGYPRARSRSLMLWACDFAGNHIWLWEGACGFSWQVSQTHCHGHSHLCPHRSHFLHSDAWLHGWGIIFTKDSGTLHPLKGMSCLTFVAVKPRLGWMWKECMWCFHSSVDVQKGSWCHQTPLWAGTLLGTGKSSE